jgi:hypothetical protein
MIKLLEHEAERRGLALSGWRSYPGELVFGFDARAMPAGELHIEPYEPEQTRKRARQPPPNMRGTILVESERSQNGFRRALRGSHRNGQPEA